MDIIAAYREVGTFRGAAEITGTTHKTVRRVIARHEAGSAAPARPPRSHNYDGVAELVAARVKATAGRISAKRRVCQVFGVTDLVGSSSGLRTGGRRR